MLTYRDQQQQIIEKTKKLQKRQARLEQASNENEDTAGTGFAQSGQRGQAQAQSQARRKCYICDSPDHVIKDCP